MTYTAIIIDDEEKAIKGLQLLIELLRLPIEIVGTANEVVSGVKLFRQKKPDILFLDIVMIDGTGFDFLELADKGDSYFIFISAHEEYALRAIKMNVDDYLLKPIAIDDLKQSAEKAFRYLDSRNVHTEMIVSSKKIGINTNKGTVFKNISDIVCIKASSRYSEIMCTDGSCFQVCKNIGEYEVELAHEKFFRVHKTFLVNYQHVMKLDHEDGGFLEMTGGIQIEISRRKRTDFIRFMQP